MDCASSRVLDMLNLAVMVEPGSSVAADRRRHHHLPFQHKDLVSGQFDHASRQNLQHRHQGCCPLPRHALSAVHLLPRTISSSFPHLKI